MTATETSQPTSGLHIARITIEAASPISLAAGEGDVFDVMLARDALGLPVIPGASLQGVLKSLLTRTNPPLATKLFGTMQGRSTTAGRLQFSNAAVHNGSNQAVKASDDPAADDLLRRLLADDPLLRDHVALDHRGTAANTAKFDRTAVPVGTRFSFELLMWGSADDGADFTAVLNLLTLPLFRLGGATRRGYGRIGEAKVSYLFFGNPKDQVGDIATLRGAPLSCHDGLPSHALPPCTDAQVKEIPLMLTPLDYWRAGGGGERTLTGEARQQGADPAKEVDDAFTREPSINWEGVTGTWCEPGKAMAEDFVLQGSSIRGALAHRALFHWNKAKGHFVTDTTTPEQVGKWAEKSAELLALFGAAATDKLGNRSALIVDDVRFQSTGSTALTHNSIDRFTGGVRTRALYSEELVISAPFAVRILIDESLQIETTARDALNAAIRDLCTGRLSLGARSLGWFEDKAFAATQESGS
jgi:CRISPR/Cas system CSM-associated protein Csm3 (group 7 of RAMP superfamily)